MLHRLKLSTRIMLLGIIIIVCFSLTFAWILPKIKKNLYDAKSIKTRNVVEAAWGVLDFYSKQAKSNAMPLEEAKKKAKETVRNLRYDQDDYFWINDAEPRMVMHPIKTEMDGKSLSDEKDPNGRRIFVDMAETCKNHGAGFVDYLWPKPGFTKPVPKVSYVKLLPDWGWIIGSGIYLNDVEKEVAQILYIIFGVVGVIAIGGLGLSYGMARSIAKPLNRVIEGLAEGSDQVSSASSQVSSSSQSLAEGASEQAAGIEETSSSIEEMTSMTKQNADNARQANSLMTDTGTVVDDANHAMKALTQSMNEISKASEETAKIIKTIDEIAFQTNLLALNAAVEAARAGEAGAGFAVVADEVRNLAMRAADAAKNTSNLIEESVKKIKSGSEIVSQTNEAFGKVATGSKKVSELVGEIAAASQEQAQGIEQINKAVAEMDKVVQKNAANAEESAAASEEMNAQAEQMKGFVQDLSALVAGGSNGMGLKQACAPRGNGKKKGEMAAVAYAQSATSGPRQSVAGPLKKRREMKSPFSPKSKEVRPDQVIPLEEGDFQEF